MGILGWIVFGLIVGAIAKLLMPGKDPGGIIVTMLLGIVGALLGGFAGRAMGLYVQNESAGIFMSILGAVLVLFIYRLMTGRRSTNLRGFSVLEFSVSVLGSRFSVLGSGFWVLGTSVVALVPGHNDRARNELPSHRCDLRTGWCGSGRLWRTRAARSPLAPDARGVRSRRALPDVPRVRAALRRAGDSAGRPPRLLARAGWCFAGGIVVFSGSLYALALTGTTAFGAITPIGGLAFLAGWALVILDSFDRRQSPKPVA